MVEITVFDKHRGGRCKADEVKVASPWQIQSKSGIEVDRNGRFNPGDSVQEVESEIDG